ncbi:MAG: flagellar basal body rod protein FlgB [Gammaproteobacteria bacterium]|jgi:flagellar basal-body rod protein FlgB|nr:flagellar basal body rod protein FlgB [Gammaproteobacteria bacterium]MBT3723259.1 flagellar basal body rod protein FlgB [Gammaproteobacteria bacterium]MBT4077832.1 flagellar basal body rod protein FlgB [Gammaproteobacteria bacterium]MBT4196507.1 flagellar basal body rod protein FlgB [Gammaproteobacteria bacterium]MBT4450193.1 flagellar basal body rod protein FlgB [Gammaproteobacteria bacterium]
MSIIDRAFSIHDDAMILRSHRTSILAANIANADTPDYKARDMDFSSMLKQAATGQGNKLNMARTNESHLSAGSAHIDPDIKYRNPLHASLDGNTVDSHVEQAKFSENAVQYQTSLTMLNGKIRGLNLAIKGQ